MITMYIIFIKGISARTRTSNYYWGHFKNRNDNTEASVILLTTESQPVPYFIEAPGVMYYHNGTLTVNNVAIIDLPDDVLVKSHAEQHKGIHVGI